MPGWRGCALSVWATLACVCCRPVEAQDPAELLADDFEVGDGEHAGEDPTVRSAPEGTAAPASEDAETASEEQCRRAVEHSVELGLAAAVEAEDDPQRRARVREATEEMRGSETLRERIEAGSRDCLAQGRTRGELACVLRASTASELERCE